MSPEALVRRVAALAILVAGAVHLHLWLSAGYRSIHAIGPLFLVNALSAAVIASLLLVRGGALVSLVAVGYALSTLAAFFLSVYVGLFGFVEVLGGTPQIVAGVAELTAGAAPRPRVRKCALAGRSNTRHPNRDLTSSQDA